LKQLKPVRIQKKSTLEQWANWKVYMDYARSHMRRECIEMVTEKWDELVPHRAYCPDFASNIAFSVPAFENKRQEADMFVGSLTEECWTESAHADFTKWP